MDNRYLGNVVAQMQSFLNENGFKKAEEGLFEGDDRKILVEYNEQKQMFLLKVAVKDGEDFSDFAEIGAWLFDDGQNEKDAESVGMDFVDTLRKNMGIKAVSSRKSGIVELPSASKTGALTISGFAKKVLDIYPKFKEPYKEHIEKYGNFLYMSFFGETLIPEIVESVNSGNAKARKKVFDLCENAYVKGNKETVNTVVACLAAACSRDQKAKAFILDMLSLDTHLKSCVEAFIPMVQNKKIKDFLIK